VPDGKNLLFSTLGSQRNMYRIMLDKWGLLTAAPITLGSNISAPRQNNLKKIPRMFLCKTLLFMTLGYIKKCIKIQRVKWVF